MRLGIARLFCALALTLCGCAAAPVSTDALWKPVAPARPGLSAGQMAGLFHDYLRGERHELAYGLFSQGVRDQITMIEFMERMVELDRDYGKEISWKRRPPDDDGRLLYESVRSKPVLFAFRVTGEYGHPAFSLFAFSPAADDKLVEYEAAPSTGGTDDGILQGH
ncbi:MAG: hypothetical protein Q8Q08_06990 [Candidatus Omnitrophota bacterium]|nr:hypothetical protein [Candidatus Omnitrophota bacterium]MDZ4242119.1 hypothetical protein [Candidatus Omnitrophota bacterium]